MNIKGSVGELRFKVQVTRKETGKVDEYEMTSAINAEQLKQLQEADIIPKEKEDGRHS